MRELSRASFVLSKHKLRSAALLLGLCGALVAAGPSYAQQAPSSTTDAAAAADQTTQNTEAQQNLQEVVVTGSLIQRTSTETPAPLQTISAADLLQSGYSNVSDMLRNVSANGAGTLSQSFEGAFAIGGSGVALRGLAVGATLTLIDSERMVPYPLADDNQRDFVDISQIPTYAIDHIDVLKDGASAIYGSDAIAGVVNVVLRKTYTGYDAMAEGGTSYMGDGSMEHAALIGGIGDLGADGYNLYATAEFRHQGDIPDSNRSGLWTNLNWTPYGGVNTTPGVSTTANPLVSFPASITGYLANPGVAGPAYAYLPGCPQAAAATAKGLTPDPSFISCPFNYTQLQIQPETMNMNALVRLTKAMGSNWQSSAELSLFNSQAQQFGDPYDGQGNATVAYPAGIFGVYASPWVPPTLSPAVLLTVPSSYPGNPYGAAAPLIYSFSQLGVPEQQSDTNTYRLMLGLDGTAKNWTVTGRAGLMYSSMILNEYGTLDPSAFQNALNHGYIVGPSAQYGQTPSWAPLDITNPASQTELIDLHGTRDLFMLPGGPLGLALGYEYFENRINAVPPPEQLTGLQVGPLSGLYDRGSQADNSVYGEIDGQVLKSLEVNAAIRYDRYNTYGGGSTPKFGLRWQPFQVITLRGTYGQGFRAPSIAESRSSGETFAAGGIPDPVLCPSLGAFGPAGTQYVAGNFPTQCSIEWVGFTTAGQNLKAVRSENLTLGFVLQPDDHLNLSADYFHIKLTNDIISQLEAGGLFSYTSLVRTPTGVPEPYCAPSASAPIGTVVPASDCTATAVTPVGLEAYAVYPYINASQTITDGWDIDLRTPWSLGRFGQFTGEVQWTHMMSYTETVGGTTWQLAGTHGPSGVSGDTGNPKDRGVITLAWNKGPVNVTATVNYVGSFSVIDPSAGYPTCQTALVGGVTNAYGFRFPSGATGYPNSFCTVPSFTDLDLYARYNLTEHFSVHASVLNALNAGPSLDLQTYGGGGQLAYSTLSQAGAVGSFFTIGVEYAH